MNKKTAQFIEEQKSATSSAGNGNKQGFGHGKHPNSRKGNANLKPFPKGVSGNPSGLPGTDVAAVVSRQIFEQNQAAIYEGMGARILNGEPYAFQVLADRAYGKVREHQRIEHTGADGGPLSINVEFVKPDDKFSE